MPSSGSMTSPVAGEQEGLAGVGDDEQGFELAQHLVGAPVLGELDGGAAEVAGILLELGFEAGEEREGVGGGAGEAGEDLVLVELADFLGGVLHDGAAERDLAIGGHDDGVAAADADDGGGANAAAVCPDRVERRSGRGRAVWGSCWRGRRTARAGVCLVCWLRVLAHLSISFGGWSYRSGLVPDFAVGGGVSGAAREDLGWFWVETSCGALACVILEF